MGCVKKAPVPKICHTYPTIWNLAQLYFTSRKLEKYLKHVTYVLNSADIKIVYGNQQTLLYQEIQIQISFLYIFSNSFNFFGILNIILINIVIILIMSAKIATLGLLKLSYLEINVMTSKL